jgi:kynurenine formamidase
VTGKDHAANCVDTIEAHHFIAPAAVVDASAEVASDPDWLLTVDFLRAWEVVHGRIPAGSWLLLRTDWSRRIDDAAAFVNLREDGAHTPGPTQEAVEWLVHERHVHGFGVETINTDAGQSHAWSPPYPCHRILHGANRYGLQCLRNLDQLPPTGALVVAAPLKILHGSGSPLRVLAIVPARPPELLLQRAIQRRLEVDEAGVGGDVLERQDLRGPIAADAVLAVDPVEAVGQAGPHQ